MIKIGKGVYERPETIFFFTLETKRPITLAKEPFYSDDPSWVSSMSKMLTAGLLSWVL